MKSDLKLILRPIEKDGVLFARRDDCRSVILENIPTEKEIDYIINHNIDSLILIDLKSFDFFEKIRSMDSVQLIFSYFGSRKKNIEIDFSALYQAEIQYLYICASPKLIFLEKYDCLKQKGLCGLHACIDHVVNLDTISTLTSLMLDLNGKSLNEVSFQSMSALRYLSLKNGSAFDFKNLTVCHELCSLTIKNFEIHNSEGLNQLTSLKNLYVSGIIKKDLSEDISSLSELEYLHLSYNGKLSTIQWLRTMPHLKVFIVYCRVMDGDLSPCDPIPYAKIGTEYSNYNRKNEQLQKVVVGEQIYGIPTYKIF